MLLIDFINVGYGDAVLIRDMEASFVMLVDCGDSHAIPVQGRVRRTVPEFLRQEGVDVLDLVVLTHLHRDHCGALAELVKDVKIRALWSNYLPPRQYWGGVVPPICRTESVGNQDVAGMLTEAMNSVLEALGKLENAQVLEQSQPPRFLTPGLMVELSAADSKLLSRQREIWHQVLSGVGTDRVLNELDGFINHTSLRLRLDYYGQSVELPGDLNAADLERLEPPACDILKLGHHGHTDAMSQELLRILKPKDTVVSVAMVEGDVCPDRQILHWLECRGCRIHITDELRGLDAQRGSVRFCLPGSHKV